MMELETAIARLANDKDAIAAMFTGISDDQARWKPSPNEWSLLEVIVHLYDEEREDFRTRLDILLHRPGDPFPPIDPQGWVLKREYNEQEPQGALQNFLRERERSLGWLNSLSSPDWSSSSVMPWGSTMSAGDMLHCWLAHDMLHLRQLAELHYRFVAQNAVPGSIDYAGSW